MPAMAAATPRNLASRASLHPNPASTGSEGVTRADGRSSPSGRLGRCLCPSAIQPCASTRAAVCRFFTGSQLGRSVSLRGSCSMHSKKDDAPKAGKSSSRSNILPVTVPAGGAAYNPPTVNAKPTQHELTSVDKSAAKKASGGVAAGPDEKDLKYLAAHSQILRASHGSHGGFSQISQSSTPISCTPRPLSAVPYPVVSSVPRPQSEYGTWAMVDRTSGERPRESDRPRKFEEDKIHKLCQLVILCTRTGNAFRCISLHFIANCCISLHFIANCCISLHFIAYCC